MCNLGWNLQQQCLPRSLSKILPGERMQGAVWLTLSRQLFGTHTHTHMQHARLLALDFLMK